MRYLHSMIRVGDLDAAIDFFVGKLGMVEVNRRDNEKGRFTLREQGLPSWAHPVISGGRLYVRSQGVMNAYDVRVRS